MKQLLRMIHRALVWLGVTAIYGLGCLCYDRKYLVGENFNRWHFSYGWQWILKYWFGQKILGKNRHVPWPVPPYVAIGVPENICFHPDDMRNFHTIGSYFQGIGAKVIIGKGCRIAAGTGFITANHDYADITKNASGREIVLGDSCWVGMNAVLLPGVHLGPHTMVGAGSVVTKSFPEGYCVVAGNPARVIKTLDHINMDQSYG